MRKLSFLIIMACLAFLLSCSNHLIPEIDIVDAASDSGDSVLQEEPRVFMDSERNSAVFLGADGNITPILSVEESGEVSCIDVLDYFIFDQADESNRSLSGSRNPYAAVILGKRNDGNPGMWFVLHGGRVVALSNEEGGDTSELLGIVEGERSLSRLFGWTYDANDMVVNDDEIIIVGTALNEEGISWRQFNFGAGTKLGVYWSVSLKKDDLFHISRARVIGVRDQLERGNKGFFKRRTGWLWLYHLFFKDWYFEYMTTADTVSFDDSENYYIVTGTDHEDDAAIATLIPGKVLSIEKNISDNLAPSASFEVGDFRITGAGLSAANGVYEESGTLNGSSYYSQLNGEYKIFINSYTDASFPFSNGWYWAVDTNEASTSFSALDYVMRDNDTEFWLPEDGTWYAIAGASPAVEITGIPFLAGSDGADEAGETVSVAYSYYDPEGDSEGASEIRWYRCDNIDSLVTDAGSVEVSSGSADYVIQSEDINHFLKVQVIPVDSQGNRGEPVVSKAYRRLGNRS